MGEDLFRGQDRTMDRNVSECKKLFVWLQIHNTATLQKTKKPKKTKKQVVEFWCRIKKYVHHCLKGLLKYSSLFQL